MLNYSIYIFIQISIIFFFYKYSYALGKKFRLIDSPKANFKLHTLETPAVGGIMIFLSLLNLYFLEYFLSKNLLFFKTSFNIIVIGYFVIGLMDDYLDLRPFVKIVLYAIISYLALIIDDSLLIENVNSINFGIIELDTSQSYFFTILCFLFIQNILNMFDGINGSLLTQTILVLIILVFLKFEFLIFMMLINVIILNYLNISGKLFLGNNGSSIVACMIGVLLIFVSKSEIGINLNNIEYIIIVFFIPIIDFFRLFLIRTFNGKSPMNKDLNHFHHIVLKNYNSYYWISSYLIINLLLLTITIFVNINFVIILMLMIYILLINKKTN